MIDESNRARVDAHPTRGANRGSAKGVSFASVAPLPSNIEAIEAALLFAIGQSNLVALVGPSGWGKSQLLDAVSSRVCQESPTGAIRLGVTSYLSNPQKYEHQAALILDDVQEVFGKTKLRQILRFQLERRVRAGRPTMLAFTASKVTRRIKMFLPASREWTVAQISAPAPEERVLLLNQMADEEDLALSPRLTEIIGRHMHGNGRTLSGALKRLRLGSPSWLDDGATLKACGMLNPFFADNPAWDLRLKILRAAEANRHRFPKVSWFEMALYTMLNEAALAEADVARIAEIEPADVYGKAVRFRKQMESSREISYYVEQFVQIVVQEIGD